MSYSLLFSREVKHSLVKFKEPVFTRISDRLHELSEDRYSGDIKKVKNSKDGIQRTRVGNYRILYKIFEEDSDILIIKIDKRSKVYR